MICAWPAGTITIEPAEKSGIVGVRYFREANDTPHLLTIAE